MAYKKASLLVAALIEEGNESRRREFLAMGDGGRCYTKKQKQLAFNMMQESGIRATSRILRISRRTLQRWRKAYGVKVSRCPPWVYDWAERRRKRREFWSLKGY